MTKSKVIAALGLIASWAALPQDTPHPRPGVRTQAELLAALDNGVWVSDGKAADKQIYVIAAPWCGVCRELYKRSRGLTNQVQFRWLEMDPRDEKSADYVAEAAASQDAAVLAHMYRTMQEPPHAEARFRDSAIRYNMLVEAATESIIGDLLRTQQPQDPEAGFPTLIWLTADGVKVQSGLSDSLDSIVRSVAARPEAASVDSAGRASLSAEYRLDPLRPKQYYAKEDGVRMYSAPDSKSLAVYLLPKDFGYPGTARVTVKGEAWIALDVGDFPPPGLFVREADVFLDQ